MTRLFLDTEWADAEGEWLVGLVVVGEDGEPWRTGFRHPGCKGEILGVRDGTRIALKSRVLTYSPEGEPLSDGPDAWDYHNDGQVIAEAHRRGWVSGLTFNGASP